MKGKRWQDLVMLLLGMWLFVSPFVLQYAEATDLAAWNSYLLGFSVVVVAGAALLRPQMWEEWVNLALGIWLIIAPFVLVFYLEHPLAMWNHIIIGLLIGGDALWTILQQGPPRKAFQK